MRVVYRVLFPFFFNDTATTEIYTLSLHDALPICYLCTPYNVPWAHTQIGSAGSRSEEHTSELQSLRHLVCRLLLEKKKTTLSIPIRYKPRLHFGVKLHTEPDTNEVTNVVSLATHE